MPTSPLRRAQDEGLNQPEGSSAAGSGAGKRGKRKSKPTKPTRNRNQKVTEAYAKAREDAQLAGVIPTTPEGAVRDERVDPVSQEDSLRGLPAIVRQAVTESWATPDSAKTAVVAALLRPFYNDVEVIDASGNIVAIPPSPKLLNELARTLHLLDQSQYERDNPRDKKESGPFTLSVNVVHVPSPPAPKLVEDRNTDADSK